MQEVVFDARRHPSGIVAALGLVLAGAPVGCLGSAPPATRWDREPFSTADTTRVLGCVELAFTVERDGRLPDDSLLLDVSVGNKCVRPAPLDLGQLRIAGLDANGSEVQLSMYDPRGEIHATSVDSEVAAVERIRVDGSAGLGRTVSLCIDVTHVSREAERAAPARVCMGMPEGSP